MARIDRLRGIRAVVFDAVGTLLRPLPPAAEVYAEIGHRYGSELDTETVRARFDRAFRQEEECDRLSGWRTNAAREELRWRNIVANTLGGLDDPEGSFRALWDHFGRPTSWTTAAGADQVLTELRQRGYRIGIATNFDSRLRTVLSGYPALSREVTLVISAEIGWRKPSPEFFAEAARLLATPVHEILMVGNDLENDYQGAMAAGMRALLFDRRCRGEQCIGRLEELLAP